MDCYSKALSLLSAREHTEKEMRAKLSQKGYPSGEIDSVIEKLIEEGYLSEERFASVFIRSRLRKSPEGKAILKRRLLEKGTPAQIASDALSAAWLEELYRPPLALYASSLIRKKGEEGAKAMLLKKGFTPSEIRTAIEDATGCSL